MQGHEQGFPDQNNTATSFLLMGLPAAVMDEVQPQWTPLLTPAREEWAVGLTAIEVLGEGGGNITTALYPNATGSGGSGGGVAGPGGRRRLQQGSVGEAGAAPLSDGAEGGYAPAIVDSGTTFVRMPRPGWKEFQQLVISATVARGQANLVQARDAGTCWRASTPGALLKNATALGQAFPALRFHFLDGAGFDADPRGYLTAPDNDNGAFVCLSFFPWCVLEGRSRGGRGTPAGRPFSHVTSPHAPTTCRPAHSASSSLSDLVLLGSRVRQNVLTLHDDTNERIGFAQIEDCSRLAAQWAIVSPADNSPAPRWGRQPDHV